VSSHLCEATPKDIAVDNERLHRYRRSGAEVANKRESRLEEHITVLKDRTKVVWMRIYTNACMHEYKLARVCMYVNIYVCVFVCIFVCMFVRMYVRVPYCLHACVYVYKYLPR